MSRVAQRADEEVLEDQTHVDPRSANAGSSDTGADHLSGSKIHDTHPSLGLVRSERSVGRTQCWQNAVMLNCTKLSGVPCSRPRPGRGTRGWRTHRPADRKSVV